MNIWKTIRGATSGLAMAVVLGQGAAADGYSVERLVPGSDFHGVHGLAVDPDGALFAGSVNGMSVYRVNRETGEVSTEIPAPDGMADDIAIAPDGTMAWTGFLTGDIFARAPGGETRKLASGLPGINSLAYRADGRLYASQVFLGDALYEIDPEGVVAPRKIVEGMGGLNGFEFGPDGKLYGPLWFKGQVVRLDVDSGEFEVLADGFKVPAAVNLDSKGNIWVVDSALGELVRLDPQGQNRKVVAKLSSALDNLAIDAQDQVFVSNMADNGIQKIYPETGDVQQLVKGKLATPGGIDLVSDDAGETLHVADFFSYRTVDGATGDVRDVARMQRDHLEYPISARANAQHVFLSSFFTGTVQVRDRATGEEVAMFHGFAAPMDAIEMPDGALLVLELAAGQLTRVTGEDGKTRKPLATGLTLPVGMVADGPNAVIVSEAGAGTVARIDLATGEKTVIASGLSGPEGMDMTSDGQLVVAEVGKRRVVRIDPGNGALQVLAEDLPLGLPPASVMPPVGVPTGVAAGQDGTIYVTSDIEHSILMLKPM